MLIVFISFMLLLCVFVSLRNANKKIFKSMPINQKAKEASAKLVSVESKFLRRHWDSMK